MVAPRATPAPDMSLQPRANTAVQKFRRGETTLGKHALHIRTRSELLSEHLACRAVPARNGGRNARIRQGPECGDAEERLQAHVDSRSPLAPDLQGRALLGAGAPCRRSRQ